MSMSKAEVCSQTSQHLSGVKCSARPTPSIPSLAQPQPFEKQTKQLLTDPLQLLQPHRWVGSNPFLMFSLTERPFPRKANQADSARLPCSGKACLTRNYAFLVFWHSLCPLPEADLVCAADIIPGLASVCTPNPSSVVFSLLQVGIT